MGQRQIRRVLAVDALGRVIRELTAWFAHAKYAGAVTLSGKGGEDSKPYQEKQVKQAIEEVKR